MSINELNSCIDELLSYALKIKEKKKRHALIAIIYKFEKVRNDLAFESIIKEGKRELTSVAMDCIIAEYNRQKGIEL